MSKNQWVVKRGENWAVRGEKNTRDTSVHDTQAQAIVAAREIARNQGSELIIQGADGRIREKNSYGPDSFPPPG